jgi:hypothetical protein
MLKVTVLVTAYEFSVYKKGIIAVAADFTGGGGSALKFTVKLAKAVFR